MAVNDRRAMPRQQVVRLEDPPVARFLFDDVRMAPVWLILRLWLAWKWLDAGWAKVQNPAWTGPTAGAAITGFVQGAVKKTTGDHPDVPAWYGSFLEKVVQPNANFWSHLVAYGELLVGIALVLGIFTGIAAFFGAFMNFNYLLSGTVSTNPMMFLVAGLLVLAWKTAGWLGVDRFLLPALGTPWAPGKVFRGETPVGPPVAEPDRSEI